MQWERCRRVAPVETLPEGNFDCSDHALPCYGGLVSRKWPLRAMIVGHQSLSGQLWLQKGTTRRRHGSLSNWKLSGKDQHHRSYGHGLRQWGQNREGSI